jgi:hypothetical protein
MNITRAALIRTQRTSIDSNESETATPVREDERRWYQAHQMPISVGPTSSALRRSPLDKAPVRTQTEILLLSATW